MLRFTFIALAVLGSVPAFGKDAAFLPPANADFVCRQVLTLRTGSDMKIGVDVYWVADGMDALTALYTKRLGSPAILRTDKRCSDWFSKENSKGLSVCSNAYETGEWKMCSGAQRFGKAGSVILISDDVDTAP